SRMSANRAREADGMETALTMTAARAEAHRALRVECERNRLVDGEVGEASGLWQRDPHLGARFLLVHENRRIRTVEEQARHAGRESLRTRRQLGGIAREIDDLGADERLDRVARADRTARARANREARGRRDLDNLAIDALRAPCNPIVRADEPGDECALRIV